MKLATVAMEYRTNERGYNEMWQRADPVATG
jgi:hypothetical protein